MSAIAAEALLSPEDFLLLPRQEEDFLEYDHGRAVERAEMSADHGDIQTRAGVRVFVWIEANGFPAMVLTNTAFWLNEERMCKPDVAIVRTEALASMPRYRGGLLGCPDIAIEVISDSERTGDVEDKTRLYLDSGAKAVWNIFPRSKTVTVWRAEGRASILSPGEFLEAEGILPGLRIAVASLFA